MKNFSMNISNMALYAVNKKYAIKKKKIMKNLLWNVPGGVITECHLKNTRSDVLITSQTNNNLI